MIAEANTIGLAPRKGLPSLKPARTDVIVCVALALASAIYVIALQQMLTYTNDHLDIWFDSDSLFVVDQKTNRWSAHNDTNSRHPIFVLLTFPIGFTLKQLGLPTEMAVLPILVLYSTLFVVTTYVTLRLMERPVGVALAFTGILAVSTPGMFFLGVHERLIPSGLSILVLFAAVLACRKKLISSVWVIVAAALTLGLTITNFAYAVVALPLLLGFRQGLQGLANAFASIALISTLVPLAFPTSTAFLDVRTYPYTSMTFSGDERIERGGSTTDRATAILAHSIAMPTPSVQRKPTNASIQYLSVQRVGVTGHHPAWYGSLAIWFCLLGAGLWAAIQRMKQSELLTPAGLASAWREGAKDPFPWILVTCLTGKLALFMFYGTENILFSSYFVPTMILLAGMAWKPGRTGRIVLIAVLVLLALLAWNNGTIFLDSVGVGETLIPS